jgi:outer membrane protein OmpA-like peptidoglycan-associated protein
MRKILLFSLLSCVLPLAGCATIANIDSPAPMTPATPVFFQPFSAALDNSALTTIAAVAKAANAEPGARVTVTGAADTVGSAKANKYLSETRAQVVADALESYGVADSRIRVRSVGAVASPNGPGVAAQYSRRALITIGG